MGAGAEIVTAEAWLYRTLKADGELVALIGGADAPRIFSHVIPQDVALPAVVFQAMSASDLAVVNARRVWVDAVYLVKVVSQAGTFAEADAIYRLVDTALHRKSGSVPVGALGAGRVVACVRERPFCLWRWMTACSIGIWAAFIGCMRSKRAVSAQ